MDASSNALIEMGASLAALAVKGTASAITTKVKIIKQEKDIEIVRTNYDGIINELISEREEAIRIAQAYKSELDRIEICDEDIQHLHNTVERILEIVREIAPTTATSLDDFAPLKELISIDTLKALQLLGFNYKAAIGDPLTELCAEKIRAQSKIKTKKVK